jgi:heme A synthase
VRSVGRWEDLDGKLVRRYFFGIYAYVLKAERRSRNENSLYLAYSTLLALVFLQTLVIASVVILSGGFKVESDLRVLYGVILAIFVFAINWLLYVRKNRYEKVISRYFRGGKGGRKAAQSRAAWFVGLVFLQFYIVVIAKVIEFS